MAHRQHHHVAHRGHSGHHGGVGMALAQLAIGIIGSIARNKIAEQAHKRQAKAQQADPRR